MNKFLLLTSLLSFSAIAQPTATNPPVNAVFLWNIIPGVDTNTAYNLYWTTNPPIPLVHQYGTNTWPLLCTIYSPTNYGATMNAFYTNLTPGVYFFALAQTNLFWKDESFFSNIITTPPAATPIQLNGFRLVIP